MFPPCTFAGHAKPNGCRFCRLNKTPKTHARLVSLSTCLACPHAGSFSTSLEPIITPPLVDETEFPACVHLGPHLRRDTIKTGCCGTDTVEVRACDLLKETTSRKCSGCGKLTTAGQAELPELTGPANLMMFIYPRRETREVWQAQLAMIRAAIPQFDGMRLLWIAVDDSTAQDEIDFDGWTHIRPAPNHRDHRELDGWRWAMEHLKDQPGFTVRLHAKGAWRGTPELHLQLWWQLGFQRLLDVDAVRDSLRRHTITGPFRRNVRATNLGVPWHYSGSMYAFRNEMAGQEPPGKVHPGWYVEAWPALVAPHELAGSLGWDGVGDLYQAKSWREVPATIQQEVSGNSAKIQRPVKAPITQAEEITVREPVKIVDFEPQKQTIAKPATSAVVKSTMPPQVAIVIAGRNNRDYLREAIESALTQTIPCEVVYADDCSYDDSAYMASQYEARGLKVLPSPVHRGVCDARNRGSAATTAPYLMNLDSDDALTADYAEKSLAAMQFDTPFAYSTSNLVGMGSGFTPCPEWDQSDVWKTNHVNTSALYARWAFDLAGGWIETKSAWDWDLAMRAMRFGTPRKSGAILLYRRHTTSWSQSHDIIPRMHEYRLRNSLLSVAAIVQGNDLKQFWPWMSAVVQAARQVDVRRELVLMEDRSDLPIASEAAKYAAHFEAVRIIKGSDEGRLRAECAGNLVWIADFGKLPHLQECRRCVEALSLPQSPPLTAKTDTTKIVRRIRP